MRWVRYALVLLIATRVAAVEILEADPVLSGRLVGPKGVDAVFGEDKWSEDFRLNDYLVGSIFDDVTAESSVLFAFRISESFYSELKTQGKIQFTFTVPSLHEGDPNKVLPVEVWLLERNAVSARAAAQSRPVKLIGTIASEKLQDGQLHKFALDDLGDLQVGDLIWIGLNGRNPLDGAKHNFIVGGDLISLPGSIPPMLILSDEQIFKNPVMGIVPLELLHRRLDAPKRPEINRTAPYNVGNWVNPFIAHRQINQLGEIHQVLRRELDKLPVAQRWFLGQSLGFHSSV